MLKKLLTLNAFLILSGCTATSDVAPKPVVHTQSGNVVISQTQLTADGPGKEDTYTLIRNAFGPRSIEAPDLYGSANHAGAPHITEATDATVGNYFKFVIHRDDDHDRDVLSKSDRQRNEIKVYGGSDSSLKGYLGSTFEYRWKFRIGDNLAVTKHFTHIFQLKAVKGKGSDAITSSPILTLTANVRQGKSGLEVRHVRYNDNKTGTVNETLYHSVRHNVDWENDLRGHWFEVYVKANYAESGSLYMTVTPLGETTPMIEVNQHNIEMWRSGDDASHVNFVRPKWGIYRSLKAIDQLNKEEDEVDFADFEVTKVKPVTE
ncbi:hypothetical protein VHA01S_022_00140 [Vibrio halioticoli NBRC 102217]|uniref:Alginate lyase 2 domain-containing protein n=1 Tax=Vibrio halioticoli NBRC 102217 TaxID=1219072 RepID=V5FIC7_9VIBR|nr:hypothetical protein [Vibrio halioticoli]GAD89586.1 hypothetical protein VHA01S_022_00140 [Vibrio halioticoli NBRC 102217]